MEIVGLLIVVILIVLILFFSLMFRDTPSTRDPIIAFQDARMMGQLGIVMTETTVECGNTHRKLRELIGDCAINQEIMCGTQDSCTTMNNTIEQMLNQTLAIDLEHYLRIEDLDKDTIADFTTPFCDNPRAQITSVTTPIATQHGVINMRIGTCY